MHIFVLVIKYFTKNEIWRSIKIHILNFDTYCTTGIQKGEINFNYKQQIRGVYYSTSCQVLKIFYLWQYDKNSMVFNLHSLIIKVISLTNKYVNVIIIGSFFLFFYELPIYIPCHFPAFSYCYIKSSLCIININLMFVTHSAKIFPNFPGYFVAYLEKSSLSQNYFSIIFIL